MTNLIIWILYELIFTKTVTEVSVLQVGCKTGSQETVKNKCQSVFSSLAQLKYKRECMHNLSFGLLLKNNSWF